MKTRLEQGLSALHLSPTPSGTLERYCSLLLEQNQMMNLTAITDPDQVVDLHMLDSAALLTVDDFSGKKVIDVGTGAGFPGMVLKVLEPGQTGELAVRTFRTAGCCPCGMYPRPSRGTGAAGGLSRLL